MDKNAVWNVLKWVLAALAAGFIGQFGRSLAMRIIERHRRNSVQGDHHRSSGDADGQDHKKESKAAEKIEKKRLKQELKKNKKRSG